MINLTIDKHHISVPEGTTILEAAKNAGIKIPTLCYLKNLNEIAACRICLVEVAGADRLVTACSTYVEEGMEVSTNSSRVRKSRKTNLRLILSQHNNDCNLCVRNSNCVLQTLSAEFNLGTNPYEKKYKEPSWPDTRYIIRHESKCVKCMRCVQVCDKVQSLGVWDAMGSGGRMTVGVSENRKFEEADCALCGQCITHCPVGALTIRDDTERVYDALDDPEIITVAQIAPAVRTSWAEQLGDIDHTEATMGCLASAFKGLGFDYIFDTDFTADLTIMEEGNEFIERFTHRQDYSWPMFTSCCPGWVRFVKSQYPAYVDNLSTSKSPQQMFGAVAKSYFAEKIGCDPRKMFVVSVMPCTAKKSECDQPNQRDACGEKDVDVVLTTREFSRMLMSSHIDPATLPESKFDSPLGEATGAGHIFGATGGVMDAALRSAYYLITGKNPEPDTFRSIRGSEGWKEAVINIPGAGNVHVAVVSGLGNARRLMEAIDRGKVKYDFVEIMACPGGCAGGGGQPIFEGQELAQHRGDYLWYIDQKSQIRFSHENNSVKQLYREFLKRPLGDSSHHLLHTDHHGWEMPLNPKLHK